MSITVVIEKTANINKIKKEMTFFLGANTMVKNKLDRISHFNTKRVFWSRQTKRSYLNPLVHIEILG